MNFRVRILPQAKRDIARNARWWAEHHSAEQTIEWVKAIESQLRALSKFPRRHPLSSENDSFPYEIRDKAVGLGRRKSYRAVFTIKGEELFVLTVRANQQRALVPGDVRLGAETR